MDSPIIQIKDLHKEFPVPRGLGELFRDEKLSVKAIDGINLDIAQGEIIGLAGESGSGKTTTGEILVRLQKETGGSITIDGHPLDGSNRKMQSSSAGKCR